MKAHRSLLGKALHICPGEVLIVYQVNEQLVVLRQNGHEASEALREAVLSSLAYNVEAWRFQLVPDASIRTTGVQVRIAL